jgi:hypothetical protein
VEDQPIGKVGGTIRRYSNSFWLTSRQIRSQRNRNTTWPTHPPSPFYTAHPVEKMMDNHEKMMKVISIGYLLTLRYLISRSHLFPAMIMGTRLGVFVFLLPRNDC